MQGGSPKAWDLLAWNREMQNSNKFTNDAMLSVKNVALSVVSQNEQYKKANKRANKNLKAPLVNNTAKLQDALWKIGAFNGLKDRHGKTVVYNTAVDGIEGSVTKQAIENAKKMGYTIDKNQGLIQTPKKLAYGKTSKLPQQLLKLQASTFSLENLKNAFGRVFGGKDAVTGRTELEEQAYLKKYNTPYSLEMDKGEPLMERITYPDGWQEYRQVEGPGGTPLYESKLGKLGLFNRLIDKDGNICYQIKNDKGEIVTQCSETGNLITRALGIPTTDDAWKRHGVYGDSLIYGGTDHNKFYHRYANKAINGVSPSDIDPDNLKTGDFVDLMKGVNNHNNRLALSGRGNSHTGTVFKPYGNNGPAYILHNVGGPVYVDPLDKFGNTKTWSIMSVRRPGSKEHPYYED